jgi:hypothetical protein
MYRMVCSCFHLFDPVAPDAKCSIQCFCSLEMQFVDLPCCPVAKFITCFFYWETPNNVFGSGVLLLPVM